MNHHDPDELSETERHAMEALPRRLAPPTVLEERTVRALLDRGLVRGSGARPLRPRLSLAALGGLAAVLALGVAIGWWSTRPAPSRAGGEQFLLLLYEDESFRHAATEQQARSVVREYGQWAQALLEEGRLVVAEKLAQDGRLVAPSPNELHVAPGVSRAPEGTIAGFFVITARDYDDAVVVASRSPHLGYGGRIAVRRIEPT